jgi:hypothetical protein
MPFCFFIWISRSTTRCDRHLVIDVTVTSARTNTNNVHEIGARLPLPGSIASGDGMLVLT